MKQTTKDQLVSAGITFLATFLVVAGGNLLTNGGADLGWTAVAGILMAGVRAAIKAVVLKFTNS